MGEWGEIEAKNYAWPKIAARILDFYKICQKQKEKRKEKSSSIYQQIIKKVDKILSKDIF